VAKTVPIVVKYHVDVQQQQWFTHAEAASYCRISPRTLRRWRNLGRAKSFGGKYFRADLDAAVRNFETWKREHPLTPVPAENDRYPAEALGECRHGVYIIGDDEVSRCTDCGDAYPHAGAVPEPRRGPQWLEPDTSVGPED
jgi:hypothetical protein